MISYSTQNTLWGSVTQLCYHSSLKVKLAKQFFLISYGLSRLDFMELFTTLFFFFFFINSYENNEAREK